MKHIKAVLEPDQKFELIERVVMDHEGRENQEGGEGSPEEQADDAAMLEQVKQIALSKTLKHVSAALKECGHGRNRR